MCVAINLSIPKPVADATKQDLKYMFEDLRVRSLYDKGPTRIESHDLLSSLVWQTKKAGDISIISI
jgi:hypothetical protein